MTDAKELRKLCLTLSMNLNTGYDKLTEMPFFELLDMCEDLREVQKDAERRARRK